MVVATPPQVYILQRSCHHNLEPINLNPEPNLCFQTSRFGVSPWGVTHGLTLNPKIKNPTVLRPWDFSLGKLSVSFHLFFVSFFCFFLSFSSSFFSFCNFFSSDSSIYVCVQTGFFTSSSILVDHAFFSSAVDDAYSSTKSFVFIFRVSSSDSFLDSAVNLGFNSSVSSFLSSVLSHAFHIGFNLWQWFHLPSALFIPKYFIIKDE